MTHGALLRLGRTFLLNRGKVEGLDLCFFEGFVM